ncbi:MAG TPA: ATP-binding protein [Bryobacteraceae bacterium]|nr:ATP-binding protein [Bryobacteraceae bacterium]
MPAKNLLRDHDRKFRLLFQDHPQAMWLFDPETRTIVEANGAAAKLYGYAADEMRAMPMSELQSTIDLERFITERGAAPKQAGEIWRHRTKSGRAIDVEIAVHDIDFSGKMAHLAVVMDVTGRRELEEQLRQAQKMEAVGMLAGGVAHDFNNLLTIINGYSQLMLNNLPKNDPNRHFAEQIMKAGDRAAGLTNQLLAFSRRQVMQPKVLDLNHLVTGLSAMLRRLIGEDIDLRLTLRDDVGRVNADPGQIEQVLMNLVVNARDAMPRGGSLTVETANVALDDHYAGRHITIKPGPYVLLAVSDTGTGMDEATKNRLFEPFYTTKAPGKGTGLGLSTVFGIVKQSGGSVEIYSEPGAGTSIKVYLPRIDQQVTLEREVRKKVLARGSETILLVEDDEMVRNLVRETLERDGYKVIDSADPVEAQRLAENYRGRIQLLITDVVMPKLSGKELSRILTGKRTDMKVLYMSGYTDSAIVNSGILQKEVAFLQKPFTPASLSARVREVIESDPKTKSAGE